MEIDPMTDEEFTRLLDDLIEKGIVNIGRTERGEIGFVVTALGMEAFNESEKEIVNVN